MKCRFVCRSVRVVLIGLTALCLSHAAPAALAAESAAGTHAGGGDAPFLNAWLLLGPCQAGENLGLETDFIDEANAMPRAGLTMFWLSSTGAAQEEPRHVLNGQGDRPKPVVAIDNVCAWPNLMRLRDGTLVATIHNQPSHLQQPADVECWISQDGGARWTRRGVPAPRDDADAARGMFAAGAAPNGDLVVLSTGHAKTLASKPGWGPVTPTWISRSSDGGQTWTIDKSGFPKGPDGKVLNPFGDVVVGHDGALRATAYGDTNAVGTLVFRSRDNGRTWIDPVRIAQDKGTNEVALLHLGGGKWLA